MTRHNCGTQYSTEQFWQCSLFIPGKHHSSDAVHCKADVTYLQLAVLLLLQAPSQQHKSDLVMHHKYRRQSGHLPPITWPCRASVFLQSASGRSQSPAVLCGTIFRPTSHQRRHSRLSDSTSSRFCSLSLIRTFTPDSQSLHLCGPSNNWHYLGHIKNYDDDDDDDDAVSYTHLTLPTKRIV